MNGPPCSGEKKRKTKGEDRKKSIDKNYTGTCFLREFSQFVTRQGTWTGILSRATWLSLYWPYGAASGVISIYPALTTGYFRSHTWSLIRCDAYRYNLWRRIVLGNGTPSQSRVLFKKSSIMESVLLHYYIFSRSSYAHSDLAYAKLTAHADDLIIGFVFSWKFKDFLDKMFKKVKWKKSGRENAALESM